MSPLLSICVPTYNRGERAEALVSSLVENILKNPLYNVEIVVSNNKSKDDTAKRLARFKDSGVRVINRTQHLGSAEENMVSAFDKLSGTYIWYIGDDDTVNFGIFPEVYRKLERADIDCFIFNSPVLAPSGRVRSLNPMKMNCASVEGPIDNIIESIGLLFTFAGITNVIQRRELLSSERGRHWINVSKIYSHVAWLAEGNIGKRAQFLNVPLVFYRENDYSDGHWVREAESRNIPDHYNWTIGISKLVDGLVRAGVFSYLQAGLIFELSASGQRYRLIDDIMFKLFQQLELWASTGTSRQSISADDMKFLIAFLVKCDPMNFYPTRPLVTGWEEISKNTSASSVEAAKNKMSEAFYRLYNERQSIGQMFGRFRGVVFGYEIYELPFQYVGILADQRDRVYRTFDQVDPVADGVYVLTAGTFEDIAAEASAASDRRRDQEMRVTMSHAATSQALGGADVNGIVGELTRRLDAQQAQLIQIYNSTSWTVSAPIRLVGRLLSRIFRR